ncbi:hypothetical protein, partial [Caldilinea sp.]|uniref:hypothetical protein n=1 Tax=Caldilinea sp. TaxID=2293560 RepID=UPI002BE735C6|nr:hypothetical protein [Caldilinea sp.]
ELLSVELSSGSLSIFACEMGLKQRCSIIAFNLPTTVRIVKSCQAQFNRGTLDKVRRSTYTIYQPPPIGGGAKKGGEDVGFS